MSATPTLDSKPVERHIGVDGLQLFVREAGEGPPLVVVHGGPDFDHTYLVPDMDRLGASFRLVYYDQRGRGRSHGGFRMEDVGIARFVADLDAVRRHLGTERMAVLGHSWGGHLAMRYAIAHPDRLSHLVLLNTAPATHEDYLGMISERERTWENDKERLEALSESEAFEKGDPDVVAEFYARLFADSFEREEDRARLRIHGTREDVLAGREIEDRLMEQAYAAEGFSIIGDLAGLDVPTLVVHGANDFIPLPASQRIAKAIPGARLEIIPGSGHFSFIDATDRVHELVRGFVRGG